MSASNSQPPSPLRHPTALSSASAAATLTPRSIRSSSSRRSTVSIQHLQPPPTLSAAISSPMVPTTSVDTIDVTSTISSTASISSKKRKELNRQPSDVDQAMAPLSSSAKSRSKPKPKGAAAQRSSSSSSSTRNAPSSSQPAAAAAAASQLDVHGKDSGEVAGQSQGTDKLDRDYRDKRLGDEDYFRGSIAASSSSSSSSSSPSSSSFIKAESQARLNGSSTSSSSSERAYRDPTGSHRRTADGGQDDDDDNGSDDQGGEILGVNTTTPGSPAGGLQHRRQHFVSNDEFKEVKEVDTLRKGLRRLMTEDDVYRTKQQRIRMQTRRSEDEMGIGADVSGRPAPMARSRSGGGVKGLVGIGMDKRGDVGPRTVPDSEAREQQQQQQRRSRSSSVSTHKISIDDPQAVLDAATAATKVPPLSLPSRKGKEREEQGSSAAAASLSVTEDHPPSAGGRRAALVMDDSSLSSSPRRSRPRQRRYYILTNAGKPVFSSDEGRGHHTKRPCNAGNENSAYEDDDGDRETRMMGVVQAIISIYAQEGDKLKSISREGQRIVFLLRSPIYLMAVSDLDEPEYVLRNHLDHLYMQIISTTTRSQLINVFARRSNFDLRRLIEGTESFFHGLIHHLQSDFAMLSSSLQPLRVDPSVRAAAAQAILPDVSSLSAVDKDQLLYAIVIAGSKVVTLLRPRKHSIHPLDLHLLINMIQASPGLRASETWLPLCLPKHDPDRFVYAYISMRGDNATAGDDGNDAIGLVLLSKDKEGFERCRAWREKVDERWKASRTMERLAHASRTHDYEVDLIGAPDLVHFIYKSRTHIQITQPRPPSDPEQAHRAMQLYQHAFDAMHGKSGQPPVRQIYIRTKDDACFGWISQSFELYIITRPELPKPQVSAAAHAVIRWVRKEEPSLFLREAPVF